MMRRMTGEFAGTQNPLVRVHYLTTIECKRALWEQKRGRTPPGTAGCVGVSGYGTSANVWLLQAAQGDGFRQFSKKEVGRMNFPQQPRKHNTASPPTPRPGLGTVSIATTVNLAETY